VFDAKCSQGLAPAIEAAGGVPVMDRTGHSLIKAKMRTLNSPLGGEISGHLFSATAGSALMTVLMPLVACWKS